VADDNQKRGRWQGFDLGGGGGGDGRRRWRFSLGYILLGLLLLYLIQALLVGGSEEIPYSEFIDQVERGSVESVAISESEISGEIRGETGATPFTTTRPPGVDEQELLTRLEDNNVQFTGEQPSALTNLLFSWILPILVLVLIWGFVFRRMAGGGAGGALNLGKRGVKIYDRKDLKTTFADVAGVDEAVEELGEIVEFLRNPKKYQRLGGRIPKGVLLMGPPGCGKTLLARAVAGEAGVPFFYMSGSEFVEMFVGLGAARVRELFQQAKEKAPVLIFIDEIDTIGKTRAGAMGAGLGSHDEREQTLQQLLVEMDGFDTSKGVIIMAATNRPDVLDPALLRPGRFDRQVMVDLPDLKGREAILEVHARGVALGPDVDLNILAARTPMLTGADLANIINEAALLAARREKDAVGMHELEEAIDRVTIGLERKSRVMSEKERGLAAVHEMGHALVALSVKNADPLHRVTIIPRGPAGGVTITRPLEDRHYLTESYLRDSLAMLLGGRTAEEIVYGEVSSGASSDLRNATETARAMVVEFGMSRKLGPLSFGPDGFRGRAGRLLFPGEAPAMSDATEQVVDEEVKALITEAQDRAQTILTEKRNLLDRLSKLLMVREVLEGKDLKAYVEGEVAIPNPDEERRKLEREHEEHERQEREKKARADAEAAASSGDGDHVTEQLDTVPPSASAEPTEPLPPRR